MIVSTLVKRMTPRPLVGPLLMAALVVTACDPQDIKEIVDHNGHSTPPSGGGNSGAGNTGGGGTPSNPCAATLCIAGTHCEVQPVECIKAPCPPVAVCVKNAPAVSCGGFTGKPCPGAGKCVDDPSDSCDPTKGGADCGGICTCVQTVLCVKGATFDNSPGVCACVVPTPPPPACPPVCDIFCPNGHVLDAKGCETCACNPPPKDPCATLRCAAGTHCEANAIMCVKAPCDAVAACVPDAPKVFCGGIAGIACPGAGKCVDDPTDCCDPATGGADCGGVCQCVQNVACVKGAVFDSSPKVCACVVPTTPPPMCPPVCQIFCQYGNVLDANGCATCRCNPPPSPPTLCPVEKCVGPGPKSLTTMCPDGSTAGPACVLSALGSCEWTVTVCLAKDI
jgi:hypothetical protein